MFYSVLFLVFCLPFPIFQEGKMYRVLAGEEVHRKQSKMDFVLE